MRFMCLLMPSLLQVSYTSWFLDAFNYASATNMDVLNLSIGGPDYLDLLFVEKPLVMMGRCMVLSTTQQIKVMLLVLVASTNDHIASFSSRGMSTWEIPHGYGRLKPDIVAYGCEIMGSKTSTGCKSLSGTSVAIPVVAGVVCLLVSVIPEKNGKDVVSLASIKQAVVEGAAKLSGPHMYEQGAGRLDLLK